MNDNFIYTRLQISVLHRKYTKILYNWFRYLPCESTVQKTVYDYFSQRDLYASCRLKLQNNLYCSLFIPKLYHLNHPSKRPRQKNMIVVVKRWPAIGGNNMHYITTFCINKIDYFNFPQIVFFFESVFRGRSSQRMSCVLQT